MPVIVSLVGATLCALVVVLAAEMVSARGVVGDTAATERWLVDRIGRLPGLRVTPTPTPTLTPPPPPSADHQTSWGSCHEQGSPVVNQRVQS